jgi:hypothetical protein
LKKMSARRFSKKCDRKGKLLAEGEKGKRPQQLKPLKKISNSKIDNIKKRVGADIPPQFIEIALGLRTWKARKVHNEPKPLKPEPKKVLKLPPIFKNLPNSEKLDGRTAGAALKAFLSDIKPTPNKELTREIWLGAPIAQETVEQIWKEMTLGKKAHQLMNPGDFILRVISTL